MVRVAAALLILMQSGFSFASTCDQEPLIRTEKLDGTKIGLFVSTEQFKLAPSWSPSDGEPPLSISEAYTLVMEWAESEYDDYDSAKVREISLLSQQCPLGDRYWYFRFEFTLIFDGRYVAGSGSWAAVLMDGTVIGAREFE